MCHVVWTNVKDLYTMFTRPKYMQSELCACKRTCMYMDNDGYAYTNAKGVYTRCDRPED